MDSKDRRCILTWLLHHSSRQLNRTLPSHQPTQGQNDRNNSFLGDQRILYGRCLLSPWKTVIPPSYQYGQSRPQHDYSNHCSRLQTIQNLHEFSRHGMDHQRKSFWSGPINRQEARFQMSIGLHRWSHENPWSHILGHQPPIIPLRAVYKKLPVFALVTDDNWCF